MNIRIGTDAVFTYGDGAFTLSFPLKKGGHIGVFGIGGASDIDIVSSDQKEISEEAFGEGDRDQYFGTAMSVVGVSYKKPISINTFFKATIAQSYDQQKSRHDFLIRGIDTSYADGAPHYEIRTDSIYQLMGYKFKTYKTALYASVNHKVNSRNIIRAGINLDGYFINNADSALDVSHTYFVKRHDYTGFSALIQPFVQYKWKINERMDFTAGVHSQYYSLSDSWSYAEPRLGWQWRMRNGHQFSAGLGLHSQMQPTYQYTYQKLNAEGNARRLNS